MNSIIAENVIFNNFRNFNGDRGFGVVYFDGRFYVFYALSKSFKSEIKIYSSADGYLWEYESGLTVSGRVESVTAFHQIGKIYLLYTTKTLLNKTDVRLAISKDAKNYIIMPNPIIKNSDLTDIKVSYSEGFRLLIGSEKVGKNGYLPCYISSNNVDFYANHLAVDGEYIGAPSLFVTNGSTYLTHTMMGTAVSKVKVDLEKREVIILENVANGNAKIMRSIMLGEGKPLIFASYGSSLIPIEIYHTEQSIGFRLYREILKKSTRLSEDCLVEGENKPLERMRKTGVFYMFTLPVEVGVKLSFNENYVEIGENKEIIINGESVARSNAEKLQINLLDMGNIVIIEACDKVYPIVTVAEGTLKLHLQDSSDFTEEKYTL